MWNLTAWHVFVTIMSVIWPVYVITVGLYIAALTIIIATDHNEPTRRR